MFICSTPDKQPEYRRAALPTFPDQSPRLPSRRAASPEPSCAERLHPHHIKPIINPVMSPEVPQTEHPALCCGGVGVGVHGRGGSVGQISAYPEV